MQRDREQNITAADCVLYHTITIISYSKEGKKLLSLPSTVLVSAEYLKEKVQTEF